MRPIDADALMDVLVAVMDDYRADGELLKAKAIMCAIKCLENKVVSPTLDIAPVVHGYWKHEEPVKDDGQKPFVCSTCGLRHPRYGDVDKAYFSYCPWCGAPTDAEMDGGKTDGRKTD